MAVKSPHSSTGAVSYRSFNGRKTRHERCEAPIFSMAVEILGHNQYVVHTDVAASVDAILAGRQPMPEVRLRGI